MIHLTPKAIEKLKEFADAEGLKAIVRVKVLGGGCAGMTNDICFDDNILDTDETIEQDGVKIVVDQFSIHYLDETTVDFVESEYGFGFKFVIPNAKSSCGCGSSVSY
jgi:iron-sulfur cluster insertion protein